MSANRNARHLGAGLYINIETGALSHNDEPLQMRRQLARVLKILYEKWCEDSTTYTESLVIRNGAWPRDKKNKAINESNVDNAVTALRRLFENSGLQEIISIDGQRQWGYLLKCKHPDAFSPSSDSPLGALPQTHLGDVQTEHPANAHVLAKDFLNVPVEVNGTRVATLWVPPFRQPLSPLAKNKELTLLLASTAITDLTGRNDLWHDCLTWCDDSSLDPVSVFCITGHGGCGKTRFALEFVHHLRELEGWDARFVRFERSEAFDLWANTAGPNNVLLVFDYASDHAAEIADSLRLLADTLPEYPTRRLRILLLARSARWKYGWLNPFNATSTLEYGHAPSDFFRPNTPIVELSPLSSEDRIRVFMQVYRTAAQHLGLSGLPIDESVFDGRVKDIPQDPFTLILAALASLRNGVPSALSLTRIELVHDAAKLLVEQRLRAAFSENNVLTLHTVAYATVSAGLSLGTALTVLEKESRALHLGSVSDPSNLMERLAVWFPGKDGDQLGAIEPDILGEAYVLDQLSPRGEVAVETILRAAEDRPSQVIQFLIRTAQDFCLTDSGSRTEPLQWLEALIERGGADNHRLLSDINAALPESSVVLRPYVVSVRDKLLSRILHVLQTEGIKDDVTMHLVLEMFTVQLDLSRAQREMGQYTESLNNAEKASLMFRGLAKSDRKRFLQPYTVSLQNLAQAQESVGKNKAALATVKEAVALSRELYKRDPDEFLSTLTTSLCNLGDIQGNQARYKSAVVSVQKAVELFRTIPESRRDAFSIDFARVLIDLSNRLGWIGRFDDALSSAHEAVTLIHNFTEGDRDIFIHECANCLSGLSIIQTEMGEDEAAIDTAQQAVELLHELTVRNRDAFLPELAGYLMKLSITHNIAGQHDKSVKSAHQSVELLRELILHNRGAFLSELAQNLNVLSTHQLLAGQQEEAITSSREAVSYYRELTDTGHDIFLSDLATSECSLAFNLNNAGHNKEALITAEDAVNLCSKLVAQDSDAFPTVLSDAIHTLKVIQDDIGKIIGESNKDFFINGNDSLIYEYIMSFYRLGDILINIHRPLEAIEIYSVGLKLHFCLLPLVNNKLSELLHSASFLPLRSYVLTAADENVPLDTELFQYAADALGINIKHTEVSK